MTSELAIAGQPLGLAQIQELGDIFYQSGLFTDIGGASQAIVKILAGQEYGIEPFASMSGIHIINAKACVGAGVIAARIKGSAKYDFRVVQHDDEICKLAFFERIGGELVKLGEEKFDMFDAQRAQTKNTQKFPRNMLFARCISNGYKFHCPDVFRTPVYVPEEFDYDVEAISNTTTATPATPQLGKHKVNASLRAPAAQSEAEPVKAETVEAAPTFKTGHYEGKTAADVSDDDLAKLCSNWDAGKNYQNHMRKACEAEQEKRKATGAQTLASETPAPQPEAAPTPAPDPTPAPAADSAKSISSFRELQPGDHIPLISAIQDGSLAWAEPEEDLFAEDVQEADQGPEPPPEAEGDYIGAVR